MNPQVFHHLLVRLLTTPATILHPNKDAQLVENLRYYYKVPSMEDMHLASSKAQILWKLTVCYYCGTVTQQPNTKLVTGVCTNCATPGKSFWASYQYSADWINREVTLLPPVHKTTLMGAFNDTQYLRTFARISIDEKRIEDSQRGDSEYKLNKSAMGQIQKKDRTVTSYGTSSKRHGIENSCEQKGQHCSVKTSQKEARLRNIKRKLGLSK